MTSDLADLLKSPAEIFISAQSGLIQSNTWSSFLFTKLLFWKKASSHVMTKKPPLDDCADLAVLLGCTFGRCSRILSSWPAVSDFHVWKRTSPSIELPYLRQVSNNFILSGLREHSKAARAKSGGQSFETCAIGCSDEMEFVSSTN
ncbi:uncharacterized protein LOC144625028 [Crassostrea virginica]